MKILMTNFTKMVNDSGGVAKVCCAFANEMVKRGHQVSIIHSDEKTGKFFFPIDEKVTCYNAKQNADGSLIKFPVHLKALRELYRVFNKRKAQTFNRDFGEKYLLENIKACIEKEQPDVIVSYQIEGSVYLLYNLKVNIPVVTMSHREQKAYYDEKEQFALEHSAVYQVLVPSFERYINKILPKVKAITIGNAVPQYDFSANLEEEKEQYKIVCVGRLGRNDKRQHLLFEAFAKIASKHANWIVELWGGKQGKSFHTELQQMIKNHNFQDRVFLRGTSTNIPKILRNADIFAFPSKTEAFPLALSEAMSAGLPAIAYKSCTGTNEILEDKKSGFLCDDGIDAFADAMDKLIEDKSLRIKMGKAAKESMQQFAPEKIWNKWEALLDSLKGG